MDLARRVFSQTRSMRSGSFLMSSMAARTAAALAGAMLALKIRARALCFSQLAISWLVAMKPPMVASDFEKVPMMRSADSVRPK